MSTNKSCTNCPGATDHDTAHCPLLSVPIPDTEYGEPEVIVRGCRFIGLNTDGTRPMTLERNADGTHELKSFRMEGWTCYGPVKNQEQQGEPPNVLAEALQGKCALITLGTPIRQLAFPSGFMADFSEAPDLVVIRKRPEQAEGAQGERGAAHKALSPENQRVVPVEPLLAEPLPLAALAQPSPSYAGFPKPTVLKGCNVRYAANAQPSPTCSACNGSGKVEFERGAVIKDCPRCHGLVRSADAEPVPGGDA